MLFLLHENREELDRKEFLGILLNLSEINQVFMCASVCWDVRRELLAFSMVLL